MILLGSGNNLEKAILGTPLTGTSCPSWFLLLPASVPGGPQLGLSHLLCHDVLSHLRPKAMEPANGPQSSEALNQKNSFSLKLIYSDFCHSRERGLTYMLWELSIIPPKHYHLVIS